MLTDHGQIVSHPPSFIAIVGFKETHKLPPLSRVSLHASHCQYQSVTYQSADELHDERLPVSINGRDISNSPVHHSEISTQGHVI